MNWQELSKEELINEINALEIKNLEITKHYESIIHDQKIASKERSRLENIIDSLPYSIIVTDLDAKLIYLNKTAKSVHKLKLGDSIGSKLYDLFALKNNEENLLEMLNQMDLGQKWEAGFYIKDKINKSLSEFIYELPMLDENGYPSGIIGISADVTNCNKLTEEWARLYNSTNIRNHNAMIVTNSQGLIEYANPQFCDICRYSKQELISIEENYWLSAQVNEGDSNKLWKTINSGNIWQGEIRNITKDGTSYWIEISISSIKNSLGIIAHFVGICNNITERKLIEKQIFENELRYQTLFEISPVGIFRTDKNGATIYINDSYTEITGLDFEKASGETWIDAVHPDDRNRLEKTWIESYNQLSTSRIEYRFVHQGNKEVWVFGQATPVISSENEFLGFVGTLTNITDNKMALLKIQESEKKYRLLFNTMLDGYAQTDNSGNIIITNKAFQELLGYSEEELIKLTCWDITPSKWHQKEQDILDNQVLTTGFSNIYEKQYIRKDGVIFPVELRTYCIRNTNDSVEGYWAIVRDISERKRVLRKLKFRNKQLKISNSEKDKFFSILAHDLKNPFNGFLNMTKLIVEEFDDMELVEIYEFILSMKKGADNLYKLLENLLEWSNIKRGGMEYAPTIHPIRTLVSQNIELLLSSAQQKSIDIIADIPENLLLYVDIQMINSVMRNLISNAIKFTPKGGIIEVGSSVESQDSNSCMIYIKDNGIGMSPLIQNNLFAINEKNTRLGTEGESSTGLGLLLCKEFINKHNGKIWVKSEVGVGSTFYITLPMN